MTDEERIVAAWDKAQLAFRAMLTAGVYGDPKAPETRAYTEAERALDWELLQARWERSKAEMDVLISRNRHHGEFDGCDCYHINRQALEESMREGDHFAYPESAR